MYPKNRINNIEVIPNQALRLKITNRCNWDCVFCHKEWNDKFLDIVPDDKFKETMLMLRTALWINEIHFTWGEPTKSPYIIQLTEILSKQGFKVSTTTNGTMTKELIQELFDKGLVSINISVHGLDVNTFLNSQRVKNEKWAKTMLDIQKENIEYLLLKNLEFKINTVVSGMDDINNSLYIYQFCKEKNIPMRILDNLIQKEKAKVAINSILEIVWAEYIKTKQKIASSNQSIYYHDKDGYIFAVKEMKDFKIPSVCKGCNNIECSEHFYWIRLERDIIKWEYQVRLCIDQISPNTYMSLQDFLCSQQYTDIMLHTNK